MRLIASTTRSRLRPGRSLARCLAAAAAVAVAVLLTARPAAQQDAGQPQVPTFRATIDSVSVDVIVLGEDGDAVLGLTPADFEVREDGVLQEIEAFKFIDVDESSAARPTTHAEIVSMDDQRREAGRDDTRVLVILLDDYHIRRGNSLRMREQLADFVSRLAPNDLVALAYPLSAGAGLTFSRNHEATARVIMNFEGRKYDYTPRNAFEERYQMQPPQVLERMRNEITIRAIESLAAHMGGLRDGRKTMLFVSEGLSGSMPAGVNTTGAFPFGSAAGDPAAGFDERSAFFNQTEIMSQLRHAFAAANRANTSVYTLDPRGLAAAEFGVDDRVSLETDQRMLAESLDTLRAIASETDGRAIVNRNNPLPELQQMVQDASAYYLLGYTSSQAPRDGRFHEIEVKVNRRNLDVRARKGYWAYTAEEADTVTAPSRPEAPPDVQNALDALAAAAAPVTYRALSVWLGAEPRANLAASQVTLAWEATDTRGRGRPDGEVDHVEVTARGLDGRVLFRGPAPRGDNPLVAAGLVSFAAPPGSIRIDLRSFDASGNDIDADEIEYDVPDFADTGLMVTPPRVFRGRTARDIQRIRTSEAPVPTAARSFSRTERLLLRFDVRHPAGASTGQDVVTLNLLNNLGETLAAAGAATRRDDGGYEAVVPLSPLPPGDYLIEIATRTGDDQARALLAVRVTG